MDFQSILSNCLYTLITAFASFVAVYLVKYLSKLFEKVKVDTQTSILDDTISEALDLVLTVVTSTSQTYVDSLKSSGNFTEEAQKLAFNRSKATILSMMSDSTKKLIESMYKDLDEWLNVQIEAAVRELK